MKNLHFKIKNEVFVIEQCNVISFIEDTLYSTVPKEFLYETNISDGVMNEYKNKNISEKSWIVYNTLCDFGKEVKKLKNPNDETLKKPIINTFSKYIPGSEDIKDLLSFELTSLQDFVNMYCENIDIDLDEEIIWPYHWHVNL